MSRHDYNIANDGAPAIRSDVNSVLGAIQTSNSGSSTPSTTAGDMLFVDTDDNMLKKRNNADSANLIIGHSERDFLGLSDHRYGCRPVYTDAETYTLSAGSWLDSTGKYLIELSGSTAIDVSASGAGGLDTGSEASSTWYYAYLVGDTTETNPGSAVWSVTNEAASGTITLPSGYDIKRQLPLAVRNDGSSNFLHQIAANWPYEPFYLYEEDGDSTSGTLFVLASTSTSFTSTDISALAPAISRRAVIFGFLSTGANSNLTLRMTGESHGGRRIVRSGAATFQDYITIVNLNTSQQYDRKSDSASTTHYHNVSGYWITEV